MVNIIPFAVRCSSRLLHVSPAVASRALPRGRLRLLHPPSPRF
ncbi:unnamed protein product [Linum tenue]|uniref:Uncharacterized protein n=1 Tax=Linum tenue TaxID=586396 RepID=A0AAV0II62_9ROSI|nr:unnamed protein product [Linum tenue]